VLAGAAGAPAAAPVQGQLGDGVVDQVGANAVAAAQCEQQSGKDLLANAGTRDVVKDMEVLRWAPGAGRQAPGAG
jgi:hypothetical protein